MVDEKNGSNGGPALLQENDGRTPNFLRISVKDNGQGIKQENYDKMFKLFGSHINQKKKINTEGIGLGLMICKMIVHKFNGTINFASQYKKGSVFYFTFQTETVTDSEMSQTHLREVASQKQVKIPQYRSTTNLSFIEDIVHEAKDESEQSEAQTANLQEKRLDINSFTDKLVQI